MRRTKRDNTRRLAYAAVCTAICVAVILVSRFTPATTVPLAIASLAIYIAFMKSGPLYGALCLVASVLFCFLLAMGASASLLLLCSVFAPYAVVAYLMRKLTYDTMGQALLRLLIAAAVFAAGFTVLFFLLDYVAGTTIAELVGRVGGFFAGLIVVFFALPIDVFFCLGARRILKFLK